MHNCNVTHNQVKQESVGEGAGRDFNYLSTQLTQTFHWEFTETMMIFVLWFFLIPLSVPSLFIALR